MNQEILPLVNNETVLPQLIIARDTSSLPLKKAPQETQIHQSLHNPEQNLENVLNTVLPDSREENKLLKARRILGEAAKDQSDDQVQTFVTELQYLIDSWFDYFEQHVFEGQTLKQHLGEE